MRADQYNFRALFTWIFFALVFFRISSTFSQSDSLIPEKFSLRKVHFKVYLNSQFTNTKVSGQLNYLSGDDYYSYDKKHNSPDFSVGAGLGLNIAVNKGLRFNVGLEYTELKYQTGIIDTLYHYVYVGTYSTPGWGTAKIVGQSRIRVEYSLLSIPLNFEYYFSRDKRLFYTAGLGLNTTVPVKETAYIQNLHPLPGQPPEKTVKLYESYGSSGKLFRSFFSVSAGINYGIAERSFLSLKPFFNWQISDYKETKLFYFGLQVALNL